MTSPAVIEKQPTLIMKKDATHYDRKYYDVGLLTDDEKERCSEMGKTIREGEIIVVSPGEQQKDASIHRLRNADALFSSPLKDVKACVIAGVGSSLLGTAALARSVANVYHQNVAGIVSGHGIKDLTDEAMEGWLFNRTWDISQQYIRMLNDHMNTLTKFMPFPLSFSPWEVPLELLEATKKDVRTTIDILEDPRSEIKLLLGHSKGSLVIDRALEFIAQKYPSHTLYEQLNIVSVATVLDFPHQFKHLYQFLGEFDSLGEKNSRHMVEFEMVADAEHSLRSGSPLCLSQLLPGHPQLKTILPLKNTPATKKSQPPQKKELITTTEAPKTAADPAETVPAATAEAPKTTATPVETAPAATAEAPKTAATPVETAPAATAEAPKTAAAPVETAPVATAEAPKTTTAPVETAPAATAEAPKTTAAPVKTTSATKAEAPKTTVAPAKTTPAKTARTAKKTPAKTRRSPKNTKS